MPLSFDFLEQITDCHWGGGPWFCMAIQCSSNPAINVSLDFPNQSGGTPGFAIISGGQPPGGFVAAPFSVNFPTLAGGQPPVKAAYLTQKLKMGAGGASPNGWGTQNTQFGISTAMVFMQAGTGIIGSKKFPMNVRIAVPPFVTVPIFGSFVPKNSMKVGPFPPKFLQSNVGPAGTIQELTQSISGVVRVTVDPVNLTIALS